MQLKGGQFFINQHCSSEFNVYIQNKPASVSASRVIELRECEGNDSVIIDKAYYKSVTRKIECYYKAPSIDLVQEWEDRITERLDMNSHSDFTPYYGQQYIYQAIVTEAPEFKRTRKTGNIVPFEFTVSLRPFKENYSGRFIVQQIKAFELFNPERYASKPLIKLSGSGDASFYTDNDKYDLKLLDRELCIDSKLEESHRKLDDNLGHQDRITLFLDLPFLYLGRDEIKWTNNIHSLGIVSRWWRKV